MTDNEKPLTDEELLYKEFAKGVESVMRIRCRHHINVKQHNCSEINKGECGACAFEQGIEEGRRRQAEETTLKYSALIKSAQRIEQESLQREEAAALEGWKACMEAVKTVGDIMWPLKLKKAPRDFETWWKQRKSQGGEK